MATSLAVPLAYITVLVTSLAIFSRVYRRRKAVEKTTWEAWFPTHPARDTYISLLSSSSANPVPDSLLKSALLVRATADVKRIWRLRDDKAALGSLHTRGLVGDDTMSRFAAAEKELEAEIMDVVQEANTFRQGWGQMIFQTATEMAHAERTRDIVLNIPVIAAREEKRLKIRRKWLVADHSPGATPGTTNPAGQAPAQEPAAITAPPQPASNGTKTPPVEVDSVAETPQKAASTVAEAVSTPVQIGDSGSGSNTPNSKNATPSKSSAKKKKGKK